MATCELARDARNATLSIPGRNVYSVEYLINADSSTWGAKRVVETCQTLTAPNDALPLIYSYYDIEGTSYTDYAAFCLSISVRRNPAKLTQWHATANFGPLPPGRLAGDAITNPLLRPTKYSLEYVAQTEPVTEAYNETALPHRSIGTLGPIESAAAEQFDEALYETFYRPVLIMRKNYGSLDDVHSLVRTYDNTLNSNSFFGYPRGCAKFEGVYLSDVMNENQITFWEATVRVALSREPFYRSVVNQGFRYLDGNGNSVKATDADGNELSAPINLDLDGSKTPSGQLGTMIDYRTREYTDYGGLVL